MLIDRFNLDEMQSLAIDIGATWENLSGQTLIGKAGALVSWAERHAKLMALMHAVILARPDNREDWQ